MDIWPPSSGGLCDIRKDILQRSIEIEQAGDKSTQARVRANFATIDQYQARGRPNLGGSMASLDDLYDVDDRYRAFEDHAHGILVSLAGPGTGKTFSILRRVAALVNGRGIDAESICYVTFIREIANAFQSDFEQEFGDPDLLPSIPRISTLHSLACRLIRNRGFSVGYDGELFFTSVASRPDSFESRVFLGDLISVLQRPRLNTIARIRRQLDLVKRAWRNAEDPETLGGLPSIAHAGYLNLGRAYRLIDWDHTIPLAHTLYESPENRQEWLTRIEHYLIDEFQDFNSAEQSLISSILANASSAVIVGDDDQSLFSSRGGSPDGLRALFASEEADQVSLVRCRRCRSQIVTHANTLLQSMVPDPRLMLPHHGGGNVESLRFKSSKAEIEYLAEFLSGFIDTLPHEPRPRDGVVCLFPTLTSLRFYFEKLSDLLPCYTTKQANVSTRARLAHALQLCARPEQRFVERLILEYFSDIQPRHRRRLVELVIDGDISPTEACRHMIDEGELTQAAEDSAIRYITLCNALSSRDSAAIAGQISAWTEVDAGDLVDILVTYLGAINDEGQELAISEACDAALPSTAHPEVDAHSVQFLTIQGSKGLTKNTVVMPGLEDAWLPGTDEPADLPERRRLFYVAMTRATDHVLVTHPATRARGDPMNYDKPGRSQVSRFVTDAGIITQYHA